MFKNDKQQLYSVQTLISSFATMIIIPRIPKENVLYKILLVTFNFTGVLDSRFKF